MLKHVKFIKPLSGDGTGYREKDVAGFKPEVADRIIAAGYAQEVSIESTNLNVIDAKSKK
jgi:hypothetical protein